jgi:hypothetical protein
MEIDDSFRRPASFRCATCLATHQGAYNKTVATYSDLRLLMSEIRKWLAGVYGPLLAGVTLLIMPSDFEHAVVAGLSDGELVTRARALLGEAHRVTNELLLRHPDETRLINNLTTYSSTLSAMLPKA